MLGGVITAARSGLSVPINRGLSAAFLYEPEVGSLETQFTPPSWLPLSSTRRRRNDAKLGSPARNATTKNTKSSSRKRRECDGKQGLNGNALLRPTHHDKHAPFAWHRSMNDSLTLEVPPRRYGDSITAMNHLQPRPQTPPNTRPRQTSERLILTSLSGHMAAGCDLPCLRPCSPGLPKCDGTWRRVLLRSPSLINRPQPASSFAGTPAICLVLRRRPIDFYLPRIVQQSGRV